MSGARRWARGDRGAVALEVMILVPALFVLIDVAIYAGSVATARAIVHRAAEQAVRDETIARTGDDSAQGATAASNDAQKQGYQCAVYSFSTDVIAFGAPVGTSPSVQVTVKCIFPILGATIPGIPTQVTVTETDTSVLDAYRWHAPSSPPP